MGNRFIVYKIHLLAILLSFSTFSFAQISSEGKDWGGLTLYSSGTVVQDSIFVFFSSASNPKKGSIKAKFPDGSISDFKWYKYDNTKPLASRFVDYVTENGVTESKLTSLERGGYKVSVTSASVTKDYFCWVMIDDVVITRLDIDNRCNFLEVIAVTLPTKLSISNYSIFSYWDFKSSPTYHRVIDKYSKEYFNSIVWHASNTQITVPSDPSLILTIGNPAPLYDSKYDIKITNPFGRSITSETDILSAKAAKADFTLFVDEDGNDTWTDGGSSPNGEAPLKLKFDTKSVNADSVFWQVLNDEKLFKKQGDSIIWSEGYLFSDGIGIIPNEKLVPGMFPVEHIALKVSSGCRDTMTIYVVVDSSAIKPDAIPNVFSPNGDNVNDYFLIKEAQSNISSIKSFRVSIISRQGLRVYSFLGNPKEWKGWDGKMEGTKRDAPEGIYFYIFEAKGWDDRSFKGGPYKGFLYLFRGQ